MRATKAVVKKILQRAWRSVKSEFTIAEAILILITRLPSSCSPQKTRYPKIKVPKSLKLAPNNNPDGWFKASVGRHANLTELKTPDLENIQPNWQRKVHSKCSKNPCVGEVGSHSKSKFVFPTRFYLLLFVFFNAKGVCKSIQKVMLCETPLSNRLLFIEHRTVEFVQKLESTRRLGGSFKNGISDWCSLSERIIKAACI